LLPGKIRDFWITQIQIHYPLSETGYFSQKQWRCRYPDDAARFGERAAVRVLSNSTLRARRPGRHAYGGKWRLQKRGKGPFLSAALSAKTKREVVQFNSRFDARGSANAGWEKRGRAKQKGRHSRRLAHRIAIKYLYLYLHFKRALARPCSGLLARYRRPFATRISGFFVADYKSLSPLIALPRARGGQSSRSDRRKNTRIFMISRIYAKWNARDANPSSLSARSYFGTCIFRTCILIFV